MVRQDGRGTNVMCEMCVEVTCGPRRKKVKIDGGGRRLKRERRQSFSQWCSEFIIAHIKLKLLSLQPSCQDALRESQGKFRVIKAVLL